MQTTITTWTQIFPYELFEESYDPDPTNELELDPEQREDLLDACRIYLMTEVERIFDENVPELDAVMLGNGEIVGEVGVDFDLEEIKGAIREEIRLIDWGDFLASYFA